MIRKLSVVAAVVLLCCSAKAVNLRGAEEDKGACGGCLGTIRWVGWPRPAEGGRPAGQSRSPGPP